MRLLSYLSSIFFLFSPLVLGVPKIGIQRDPNVNPVDGSKPPNDFWHSYSGIIQFQEASIPGDKSKMSDLQFIHLAKVAYDEMLQLWQDAQINPDYAPGAMAAMESNGYIFFASSVKTIGGKIDLEDIDINKEGSPGWFMWFCAASGLGTHQTGGRCAEPNVLRLFGDYFEMDKGQYVAPDLTDTGPRIAVWGRHRDTPVLAGRETYFLPCAPKSSNVWGCKRFVDEYGLKPAAKGPGGRVHDPEGQNDWDFVQIKNPRSLTCAPKL
ncbi:hypothetical protein EsH8_III_001478 [Colletotrichum jinshuiense]